MLYIKKKAHPVNAVIIACQSIENELLAAILAMSFCGNSLIGLKTHDFQLVISRSHDCVTLLLDFFELRQESQYTYFLIEGWTQDRFVLIPPNTEVRHAEISLKGVRT